VVILTKADLVLQDEIDAHSGQIWAAAPDVPVHAVSSHTGFGMGALEEYARPGKTIVFLGMSGVGKSSLLNSLMRQEVMAVKEIREDDSRGRHTTTHRQLFMLPSGAMVIDTPGMRELGLYDAEEAISAGYGDIEELIVNCRFSDCRHQTEPGCAVLAAISDGTLEEGQWERYVAQKRENRFTEDRGAYMRDKKSFQKSIALHTKQVKKKGKRQ